MGISSNLADCSVGVSVVAAAAEQPGGCHVMGLMSARTGAKEKVREFIASFQKVFGDTLDLTGPCHRVQVKIHIKGFSV